MAIYNAFGGHLEINDMTVVWKLLIISYSIFQVMNIRGIYMILVKIGVGLIINEGTIKRADFVKRTMQIFNDENSLTIHNYSSHHSISK